MATVDQPSGANSASDKLQGLKRKSVRGAALTLTTQGGNVVINLAGTAILARLLDPSDYGVLAMAMAVVGFAGLFRELGLSAAAIQKSGLTDEQQNNLFWINIAVGGFLTVVLAASSPLVGWFYGRPELRDVMLVLSNTFLINSIGTQSGAALVRQMRFGRQAIATLGGVASTLVVAVLLALAGWRFWSLVVGQLAGAMVTTSLLFTLSPFRPGWPSREAGMGGLLRFGAHLTAFDFVNYFHRNLDNVLIGRYCGSAQLGLYSKAYSLLMFPISNLRGPINSVAFPALSQLQAQPESFRHYYRRATFLIALLSMPLTAFLFVNSRAVVELLLGREWLGAAPVFSWLALAGFIQPASGFAGTVLTSLGLGARYVQCGLFNAVLLSASFVIGLPWGPVGVAAAYAFANYIVLVPWLVWAFRQTPVTIKDFANACTLPACISIACGVVGWRMVAPLAQYSPFIQLSVMCVVFCVITVAGMGLSSAGRMEVRFLASVVAQLRVRSD